MCREACSGAMQELLGLLGCIKGTAKVLVAALSWLGPLAGACQEATSRQGLEATVSQLPESTSPEVHPSAVLTLQHNCWEEGTACCPEHLEALCMPCLIGHLMKPPDGKT